MREILLVIHILAAAAWIGGSAAQMMLVPPLLRAGGETAKTWMTTFVTMGRVFYTPAAIVVLASGVGLVLNSSLYEFEQVFAVIGIVMVLIGGGLGARVYAPKARVAADAFGSGDTATATAAAGLISRAAVVELALLVVTVAAMVYRWGA